jgi:hypothetical protein
MSVPEQSDRDKILAELRARLAKVTRDAQALETAISVVESLRTGDAQPRIMAVEPGQERTPPIFAGMGVVPAAIKYLEIRGDDADTKTIAEALIAGGFETKSRKFANMLHSILSRDMNEYPDATKLVRVRKRWGLKTWKRAKNMFVVHS